MKIIVVGLGNFGSSIATKLTMRGNEVIGIDNDINKVEYYKEKIPHTIRMDATDEITVGGLPLKDTDIVIVAIGENQGVNVMVTALFKNFKVKRLISRSINPLHEKVLTAMSRKRRNGGQKNSVCRGYSILSSLLRTSVSWKPMYRRNTSIEPLAILT